MSNINTGWNGLDDALNSISNDFSDKLANFSAKLDAISQQIKDIGGETVYKNTLQVYTANCDAGWTGSAVTKTVGAGLFTSIISQADADRQALDKATSDAKGELSCTEIPIGVVYHNVEKTFIAKCASGTTGNNVTITVPANTIASLISQKDVDDKALKQATDEAKAALICTPIVIALQTGRFLSEPQSYTAKAPEGYIAEDVIISLPAEGMMSGIDIEDANTKAIDYCKKIATATILRQMEQITPTIKDGFNASWGIGSIEKGSSDFITSSINGKFNVGDNIAIQTNSKYGELGVGGAFPYKWFNLKADMSSNITTDGKPVEANDYVGVLEDGGIYRYDQPNNTYLEFRDVLTGYLSKINPHGLEAKITNIVTQPDGRSKITIDKSAVISEEGVKIYINHYELLQSLSSKQANITIPEGKFYTCWTFEPDRHVFIEFKGNGRDESFLQSPKGFCSLSLQMEGIYDPTSRPNNKALVSDLTVIGNHGDNGFRFKEDEIRLPWTNQHIESPSIYTQAIAMGSWYGNVLNCRVIDAIGYAIQASVRGCTIDGNDVILTSELRNYMGWQIHMEGEQGPDDKGIVSNNTFTGVKVSHALEGFKTQNVTFSNNILINGMMALNGSSNILVQNQSFDMTSTGLPDSDWFNSGYNHITINQLMDNSQGSTFKNILMNGAPFLPNGKYDFPMQMHGLFGGFGTPNIKVYDSAHVCVDGTDNFSPISFHLDANGALIKNCKSFHKMGPDAQLWPDLFLWDSSLGLDYPSDEYDASWNWKGGSIEDSAANTEGGTIRTVKGATISNCKAKVIVEGGEYQK